MDDRLTNQDIDILIESVESWIHKGETGAMMGTLLGSMLIKEEGRDEWERKQKMESDKRELEIRRRKERAIVLQAKLIAMRDSVIADEMTTVQR